MEQQRGRYVSRRPPQVADGWTLQRLTPPSRLHGANGLRAGADGRIYIAQCIGSQISALDLRTKQLEAVSAMGGDIVGPDDIAFDEDGNLYATEFMDGRVSILAPNGACRVLRDDLPGANGITFHQGRLFVDECRIGGRLLEVSLDGGSPRVILENLTFPNALAPGPDGFLYFPSVSESEIWKVHPDGGTPERVIGGLDHPVAVKFDPKGYIISPQSASGEVLRIDPVSGSRAVLAKLDPCLDNLAYLGERLFVSHMIDGRITEILGGGGTAEILPGGLQFPLDVEVGPDGKVYIADGTIVHAISHNGNLEPVVWMFGPGYPGMVRGLASLGVGGDLVFTTTDGKVVVYCRETKEHVVLADGLDQPYGIAVLRSDTILAVERGRGRLLAIERGKIEAVATNLKDPTDVFVGPNGTCLVSEEGTGRVLKVARSKTEVLLDGLLKPQGLACSDGLLFVIDAGAHSLIAYDPKTRRRTIIAMDLPVGAPPGVTPKPLRGAPFSGPLGPFAGLSRDANGTIYFSADTEGSVMVLHPPRAA